MVVAAADTYLGVRDFSAEEVEGSGSILQGRLPGVGLFKDKVVGWCGEFFGIVNQYGIKWCNLRFSHSPFPVFFVT